MPASPSKLSTYACPLLLSCGRLVAISPGTLPSEQCLRAGEGESAEVVVDAIVHVADEWAAVEQHAVGAVAHLHAAEHDGAGVGTRLGGVADLQAIDVRRMLRGVEVFAGR